MPVVVRINRTKPHWKDFLTGQKLPKPLGSELPELLEDLHEAFARDLRWLPLSWFPHAWECEAQVPRAAPRDL